MSINELVENIKDYVQERLNSPFVVTTLLTWCAFNRIAIFGLFHFDKNSSLNSKINWLHNQLSIYDLDWFPGLYATLFYSIPIAVLLMITYNFITTYANAAYNWSNRHCYKVLEKIKPTDWVKRTKFEKTETELVLSNKIIKGKEAEISDLKEQLKNKPSIVIPEPEKMAGESVSEKLISSKSDDYSAKIYNKIKDKGHLDEFIDLVSKVKNDISISQLEAYVGYFLRMGLIKLHSRDERSNSGEDYYYELTSLGVEVLEISNIND